GAPGVAVAPDALADPAQRAERGLDLADVDLQADLVRDHLPDVGQRLVLRQTAGERVLDLAAVEARLRARQRTEASAAGLERGVDQHALLVAHVRHAALVLDDRRETRPARRPVAGERRGEDRVAF